VIDSEVGEFGHGNANTPLKEHIWIQSFFSGNSYVFDACIHTAEKDHGYLLASQSNDSR
jgi:hypothetical protein